MRAALLVGAAAAAAADCGGLDTSPGTHQCSQDGITFNYHIPEQCTSGGCGVVFDVHGLAMSALIENRNTEMRALGDEYGYVIVQPTAPPGYAPLSSWSSRNDEAIHNFALEIKQNKALGVDGGKFHMTGFSQGGDMTWRFFCKYGETFASVAPGAMNGGRSNECFASSPEIPILYWHGVKDSIISFDGSYATRAAMEEAWKPGQPTVLSEDSEHKWERRVSAKGTTWEFIEFNYRAGGFINGHCFPGGHETSAGLGGLYPYSCPLPEPSQSAFEIGRVVMDFFRAHPKGKAGPPAPQPAKVKGHFRANTADVVLVANVAAEDLRKADKEGTAKPAKGPKITAAPVLRRNASATRKCSNVLSAGSHQHEMTLDGERRVFKYYVPASISSNTEVPMLFMFHGYGGNGPAFERTTNAAEFAEKHGWLVLWPSGGSANGWNAGGCCPLSNSDDLTFVDAMLEWAETNMCVGKKFSTGYSNGGFFSNRLACERGSVFTAIAPLAGPLAFSPSLSGPLTHPFSKPCEPGSGNHPTVLHMHGTSDGTVPYNGNFLFGWPSAMASCESWAEMNQCTSKTTDGDVTHWTGCAGGSSVELVTYPGGSHTYFSDVTQRVFDKFVPLA